MNIILIGFKNSGKTTLGKLLSQQLQWGLIDTDQLLKELYNHTNGTCLSGEEIYKRQGEHVFRAWESSAIENLINVQTNVIATGGGSILAEKNRHLLKKIGKIFYLQLSESELLQRMENQSIPAFLDKKDPVEHFKKVYAERKTIYQEMADYTINVENKDQNDILLEILQQFAGL